MAIAPHDYIVCVVYDGGGGWTISKNPAEQPVGAERRCEDASMLLPRKGANVCLCLRGFIMFVCKIVGVGWRFVQWEQREKKQISFIGLFVAELPADNDPLRTQ